MKHLLLALALVVTSFASAQAYEGKGDTKFQLGGNFQRFASGINASFDYGLAENISVGLSSSYSLNKNITASFVERFDLKARFNANLGNVIDISDKFDVYPGISISTKNFGGHLGLRYFFTDGLGVYTEFNTKLASYDSNIVGGEILHNQFTVNVGLSFNI